MQRYDVIVIGAGIAGASAAFHLATRTRVVVLERESQPGYHTTGRSAAVFAEAYGNSSIRALTVGSRAFFASPPAGFSEHPLLLPRPSLAIGRADQLDALDRLYAETAPLVPSVRRLDASHARAAAPMIRADYLAGGVLEPLASDLDVNAIHSGFLRGAARQGAHILCDAEVVALERRGGEWHAETSRGTVVGRVLVNAAGAWADDVARQAGAAPLGLVPKRRTAVIFSPDPTSDVTRWPIILDVAEEFYFKPEAGKLLGSPADETPSPPCDAQPEEIDVAVAVDRIEAAAAFKVKRIDRKWAGLRSFFRDKTPVVGFDAEIENFFWLAGQGGYGIQTAPAMGRIAGALASGLPFPDDLLALGIDAASLAPTRLSEVSDTRKGSR